MFTWNENYSVGFEEVDCQHKKFLKIADEVVLLIGDKYNADEVKKEAEKLYEYGKWHFNTESTYMSICKEGKFEDHKADHDAILLKLRNFIEDTGKFDSEFGTELMIILKKWFLNHILISDKILYNCIIENKKQDIIIKDKDL